MTTTTGATITGATSTPIVGATITGTGDRRQFRIVLGALLVALFLSALDNTIVATAMPTIVGRMGGFAKYTWVTTSYVVTSTISTLLLGKLSDLYGRRRLFLFAIAVFILGSALCGASQNIDQLIAFRALQGLGGGGIFALTFTIVADLVAPKERGRYFGMFTSMFALASLAGPLIGGVIVDNVSWRWIFYVNLPLGVFVFAAIAAVMHLPASRREVSVDWQGAVLVSGSIAAFMVALEQGDRRGWLSPTIVGLFAVCVALTMVFVWWERRAVEPLLPMRFFSHPVMRSAYVLAVLTGFTMMSIGLYFALFFQDVRFFTPTRAGLLTFPMMLGVTAAATFSGRRITATGRYRAMPLYGSLSALTGMLIASRLHVSMPYAVIAASMLLIGMGMGLVMPSISIASQNAGDPREMGIVTASANFFRTLGSAMGLAVYGAVLTAKLRTELAERLPDRADALTSLVREPKRIAALPPGTRSAVQESITAGISLIFVMSSAVVVLGFLAALSLREIPLRRESGIDARAAMAEM